MSDIEELPSRPEPHAWCRRCGVGYEEQPPLALMPTCECAGDPPVDHTSKDWDRYMKRVFTLAYVSAL